jgi:hypothetical protein
MEKELKEIYGVTLTLQAKVIDLTKKIKETKNKIQKQNNETTNIYKKVS